jgi:hypothetical protein
MATYQADLYDAIADPIWQRIVTHHVFVEVARVIAESEAADDHAVRLSFAAALMQGAVDVSLIAAYLHTNTTIATKVNNGLLYDPTGTGTAADYADYDLEYVLNTAGGFTALAKLWAAQ